MIYKKSFNSNLNGFFWKIALNKRYIEVLKNQILLLSSTKKKDNSYLLGFNSVSRNKSYWVSHIVEIYFSQTNTLFSTLNFSGKLNFFCSAGNLSFKGKQKKFRYLVFKSMKRFFNWKSKSLQIKSVALHLKNVKFMKYWILKILKKSLFIQVVKNFAIYPFNGCRRKKIQRKKEEVAERFKAADCKSVELFHP